MKAKKTLMLLASTAVLSASAIGLVGCGHEHNFGTELKSDANSHYYQCECGEKESVGAHEGLVYSSNETHHWKDCSACGYDLTIEAHNYNQEVETDAYLKTAATSTTKAVYYKSCICGKAGVETFEADAEYVIQDLTLYSVYNGTEYHTIDLSSIAQGLTLDVVFASKYVGATVNSVTVKFNGQETTNYEIVMEGDHACSLNIEPKELNVNWTPNTFVFLHDGAAKVPTAELEGVCSDDSVALTLALADGDSNTDIGSFEYIASINDTNYILSNPSATFRIISPECSTNDYIPLGIPYFNINLPEGDYYIDSSTLSVDGPTNFELKFYYTSDLEKTTPVFTINSLTNCSINITDAMETSFYVEISYAGYSGSFVIKEDDHDNIDEYGFCSKGGEYTGVDYGAPIGPEEVVFTEAGRKFLRFDINNNYHYGIQLITEDHVNFTVKVYGMSNNGTLYEIELTETPTNSFVSSSDNHFYIVVEADGEGVVEVYLDEHDLT